MEEEIILQNDEESINLFGKCDENLRLIRDNFESQLIIRGNKLIISGEKKDVEQVYKLFTELLNVVHKRYLLTPIEIKYAIKLFKEKGEGNLIPIFEEALYISERGRAVRPKTLGQRVYIEAIKHNDIVVGIGPAGTGKTYLAVTMAVFALMQKSVSRIILTRPAVEAGERLGFLPGDIYEKVNPYLRPLYDALYDMIGIEKFQRLCAEGVIEVAPLAFMRGRTLNDAFIILDEAQNTSPEQMKMFLTRLGFDSKAVITGDITQIDLAKGTASGLIQIQEILEHITGIEFVYFTEKDVVRHALVSKIICAYELYEGKYYAKN